MVRSRVELPMIGFRFSDGTPLYHKNRRSLTLEQRDRLIECGVKLYKGPFTAEEDDKIRSNWIQYANEEGIDLDRAFEYCGGYSEVLKRDGTFRKLLDAQEKSQFLPRICKGLDRRSGRQVIERMNRLFHPYISRIKGWSEEEESRLRQYLESGLSHSEIGVRMNCLRSTVTQKVRSMSGIARKRWTKKNVASDVNTNSVAGPSGSCCTNDVDISSWWNEIRKKIVEYTDITLQQSSNEELEALKAKLREETSGCDIVHLSKSEQLEKFLDMIDCEKLSEEWGKSVHSLKKKWRHVLLKIREVCFEFDDNVLKVLSFVYGEDKVPNLISLSEFCRALKLLMEQRLNRRNDIDICILQKRLV
uniref:HTH luxR-type domain-containing protein n=1 Tax=Syphacia muris TaxID=451379 RepID=A0A0N5AJF8_9BILA